MPIIPIIRQSTPTGNAAAPVLDRERRPTLDTSEVQRGFSRLNEAGKMPLQDPNAMAAPYEALGSVGRAISQAGSVIGALAIKRQDATDRRLINTAQGAMDEASLEFKAWQAANPNAPESWSIEAKRRADETVKPFLEMKELSGSAKSDLKLMADSWQKRFTIGVETDATKQTFGLTKESYLNRSKAAYYRGDRDGGDAALKEAVNGGYLALPEAEGEGMNGRITASSVQLKQMDAESMRLVEAGDVAGAKALWTNAPTPDDLTGPTFEVARKRALTDIDYRYAVNADMQEVSLLASTDPKKGLEDLRDTSKLVHLPAHQRAEMIGKMQVAIEASAQDEVTSAKRLLDLLPPEKLKDATPDNLGAELKQATPWHRAVIADAIEAKNGRVNYEERFHRLWADVGAWTPSGDEDKDAIALARIEMVADSLPTAYKARITERLKQTQGGSAPVTGAAVAAATQMALENNAFGPVNVPLPGGLVRDAKKIGETPPKERSLFGIDWLLPDGGGKEVLENAGKPVALTEINPVAKAAALDKLKAATDRLERESKMPQNKAWTPDQAKDRMMEILLDMGATIPAGSVSPNALLPSLGAPKKDLNDLLKSNGY